MAVGGSHPVPNGEVGPGGEESLGHQQIMDIMHGLQPDQVFGAGDLLTGLADKVDSLCTGLQKAAAKASEQWSGTAADSAMSHFQALHDQSAQFSAQARTAGNTLHWLGGDVLPKFAAIPSPQIATGWKGIIADGAQGVATGKGGIEEAQNGGPGTAKANSATQGYLKALNGHLQTANNTMPKSLSAPPITKKGSVPWGTSSGNSGASPGGGSSVASSPGSALSSASGQNSATGYSSPSGGNPFAASNLHNGTTAPSSAGSLQGYAPPSASPPSPYGGGSPAIARSASANPFEHLMTPGTGLGRMPNTPGEDSLPSEEVTPPKDVVGPDSPSPNGPGEDSAGAEAAGSEARAAGAAEGEGSSGMPMGAGGGGGGSGDKERQRQAWMNQDPDIWGVPDTQIGSVLE